MSSRAQPPDRPPDERYKTLTELSSVSPDLVSYVASEIVVLQNGDMLALDPHNKEILVWRRRDA